MEEIKWRQAERFRFLKLLYDKTHHFYEHEAETVSQMVGLSPSELADELRITDIKAEQIARYLCEQGLAKRYSKNMLVLKNPGEIEVEDAFMRPDSDTVHFPANVYNIINAETISNAQIQQGIGASIIVTLGSTDLAEMRGFIEELKSIIDDLPLGREDKAEAAAEAATIEAQLQSPRPKRKIIKESLGTLWRALEPLVTRVATTAVATKLPELVTQIEQWLEKLK